MKLENNQILKQVINNMPNQHKEMLINENGDVLETNLLLDVFNDYPITKNEFINTLTNKVAKTIIFSKVYTNPLAELKQGVIEYGDSIEELFVEMAQMKNFNEHWNNSSTVEGDLIRDLKPKVQALYLKKNIDKKFKTSVSDKHLRKAFTNKYGLDSLLQQIINSLLNSINHNEFDFMKNTLFRAVDGISYEGVKLNTLVSNGKPMNAIEIPNYDNRPSDLVEQIRCIASNYGFMSDEYNMANVKTFTNKKDLVLITTPCVSAKLDVNVLAHAFNVNSSNIQTKVIQVDKLDIRGQKTDAYDNTDDGIASNIDTSDTSALPQGKEPLAILIDKEFLQIWDLFQSMGTFFNPEQQYTNFFANREYLMAVCLFANATLFYK